MKFLTNWKTFEDRIRSYPGNFTDRDVEIIEDLFQEYVDEYGMVERYIWFDDEIELEPETIWYEVGRAFNAFIDVFFPDEELIDEVNNKIKQSLIPRLKKFGYGVVNHSIDGYEINLVLSKDETFNKI